MEQGFQLEGSGPRAYERYLVPAFFAPCAEALIEFAPPRPGHGVLDVACGTGIVARRATTLVGAGGRVAGVDVNSGMIEVAHGLAREARVEVTWHTADAASLPLPEAAFDLVYCQQGLQFFADRAGALREMRRVLVPGGRVAIAMWRALEHAPAFGEFVRMLARHAGDEAAAMMRAPFAGPDRPELHRLLGEAGLGKATVRIGVVVIRFRSAAELLRHEVVSSPLAGPVGRLDDDRYQALRRDLTEALAPHTDDDGLAFPIQTWLATAYR